MILYVGLAAVVTAAACFVNNRITVQPHMVSRQRMCNHILMAAIFLLLFFVSACRVDVGNDYGEYVKIFADIHAGRHVSTEIGFNAVVLAVQFVLDTGVVADRFLFALFAGATMYFFLRAVYEQSENFWFSVFLFLANGYFFSSMTSMRYYFVLSVALFAMRYAIKEQWLPFVCWIGFAALFHKSVLFVIPMYFLATRNWKKWHLLLLGAGCLSLVLFPDFYRMIIFRFYPFYENSVFDNGQTSLMNIAKGAAVLFLTTLYYKPCVKEDKAVRFYYFLNLAGVVLFVFCNFIPEVSRIGYYLNIGNLFLLPAVLRRIPDRRQRRFFTVCVVGAFCLYFAMFLFKAYGEGIRLLPYKSWLFL